MSSQVQGGGAEGEFCKGDGALRGRAWGVENSYKNGEKVLGNVVQVSESC